ncbi:hypothetical protein SAMN05444008_11125 [Cnuella takakiae]|uniref:Lipoprotein n=1 Tax=Cnuella takakiae TaxID=1302690 RepID=A0A1M5DP37_9BACT|nr:hypothetical protein [Cnuella takakiae]OLY93919.1 hypothetical protein BUE76_20070 [Cnuella takakiae]SHF68743.1 hypothetical protein SAMN05444008_11125 [Cnuella takakiae]
MNKTRYLPDQSFKSYCKWLFSLCLVVVGAAGCSGNETTTETDETGVHAAADPVVGFAQSEPFVLTGCYEMTHKRDSATLQLEVQDSVVTGRLVYRRYQRDGNTGTIKGVLRDSLILADYTFQSEGLTSVRELVLKIKDTTLVEAFGDLKNEGNKIVFSNTANLQYMEENPFVKVACDTLSGQRR